MRSFSSNTQNQRQRLLEYLQKNVRITTIQARSELDVMHPAARVQELRAEGRKIITNLRSVDSHNKVAEYVLLYK